MGSATWCEERTRAWRRSQAEVEGSLGIGESGDRDGHQHADEGDIDELVHGGDGGGAREGR